MIQAKDYVYKSIDGHEMGLRVYAKEDLAMADRGGTVVFYFGGGWTGGTIQQFQPQSEYLAKLGLTCVTVDYRVASRHGVSPFECIEDGVDSVRWLIKHGHDLGIPTDRMVLSGGSAGGHIAISTFQADQKTLANHVKGLVLFNPVLDTTETGFAHERFLGRGLEASPIHKLTGDLPKTLIFHGTEDATVPYENTTRFMDKANGLRVSCELVPYEGQDHGFFNDYVSQANYSSTLAHMERFLKDLDMVG